MSRNAPIHWNPNAPSHSVGSRPADGSTSIVPVAGVPRDPGEQIVGGAADEERAERSGNSQRQVNSGYQRREDHDQRHQPDDRHMKHFQQGQEADQHERDGGERSEQAGAGQQSADPRGPERAAELEESADEQRANADVPRVFSGR